MFAQRAIYVKIYFLSQKLSMVDYGTKITKKMLQNLRKKSFVAYCCLSELSQRDVFKERRQTTHYNLNHFTDFQIKVSLFSIKKSAI